MKNKFLFIPFLFFTLFLGFKVNAKGITLYLSDVVTASSTTNTWSAPVGFEGSSVRFDLGNYALTSGNDYTIRVNFSASSQITSPELSHCGLGINQVYVQPSSSNYGRSNYECSTQRCDSNYFANFEYTIKSTYSSVPIWIQCDFNPTSLKYTGLSFTNSVTSGQGSLINAISENSQQIIDNQNKNNNSQNKNRDDNTDRIIENNNSNTNGIKEKIDSVIQGISDFKDKVVNGINDIITNISNKIDELKEAISNGFNKLISSQEVCSLQENGTTGFSFDELPLKNTSYDKLGRPIESNGFNASNLIPALQSLDNDFVIEFIPKNKDEICTVSFQGYRTDHGTDGSYHKQSTGNTHRFNFRGVNFHGMSQFKYATNCKTDFTIRVYNKSSIEVCSRGNQSIFDKISNFFNNFWDNLFDDSHFDDSQLDSNITDNFDLIEQIPDTPISDLLLMPINYLNALFEGLGETPISSGNSSVETMSLKSANNSCEPYILPFDFFGGDYTLSLPCLNLENYFGSSLWKFIDILFSGFMIYNIAMMCISFYESWSSLNDTFDSMYVPKHEYTGYKPKHGKG